MSLLCLLTQAVTGPTEQKHYTGSTSTPPHVARLCQIFECAPTFRRLGSTEGTSCPQPSRLPGLENNVFRRRAEILCAEHTDSAGSGILAKEVPSKGVYQLSVVTCSFRNPVETLNIQQGDIKVLLQGVSSRHRLCLLPKGPITEVPNICSQSTVDKRNLLFLS